MKTRSFFLIVLFWAILMTVSATFDKGQEAMAQTAMDAFKSMLGTAPVTIPPVSDPVCVYCGANRSDSPRREPHRQGCRYFEGQSNQSYNVPRSVNGTNSDDNYNSTSGNYSHVTYNQPKTVYVPPTPIRDTPEGKAILQAVEGLGYAVGSLAAEALCDFVSWSYKQIFSSKGKVYHSDNPLKGWGITQVVKKDGKEGIWNNGTHKWDVKPGMYYDIQLPGPAEGVARSVKNNKWGVFDVSEKGAVLVPFVFDEVQFYTRGGNGTPMAFGAKDENGNMHWMIGRIVLEGRDFKFVPFPGDWSNVELTSMPTPDDDGYTAIVAKDYKTGKTKILDHFGNNYFGHHSEDRYDDIIMTGMVTKGQTLSGTSRSKPMDTYYDFYKVKNNGKMGYVFAHHTADMKRQLDSYQMLPCEYDDVTPVASIVGGAEVKTTHTMKGKEVVITRKDNKFGIGPYYRDEVKNPQYKDIAHLWMLDNNGKERPVFIVQEQSGRYIAKRADGTDLHFQRYSQVVAADDFIDMVNILKEHIQMYPDQWK